ncbi:hypothetical protein Trydic_g7477 [Trypoxylus dichotomus]
MFEFLVSIWTSPQHYHRFPHILPPRIYFSYLIIVSIGLGTVASTYLLCSGDTADAAAGSTAMFPKTQLPVATSVENTLAKSVRMSSGEMSGNYVNSRGSNLRKPILQVAYFVYAKLLSTSLRYFSNIEWIPNHLLLLQSRW